MGLYVSARDVGVVVVVATHRHCVSFIWLLYDSHVQTMGCAH